MVSNKFTIIGLFVLVIALLSLGMNRVTRGATVERSDLVPATEKNLLVFRTPFTENTVQELQKKALALSSKLTKNDKIYLFMDTPGGDISAGELLIDTLKGLPQEVVTITKFSASMGFITVQHLGERLILPSGTLMSHKAAVSGMAGAVPGQLDTRINFLHRELDNLDNPIASRMGLTLDSYRTLVRDEYWVSGDDAVKAKAADRVVYLNCGKGLEGSYTQQLQTIFGAVEVTWSKCPLFASPLSINFNNLKGVQKDTLDIIQQTITNVIKNESEFVENHEVQQIYLKYVE